MNEPVRVAVIDSGIHPTHPHVTPIAGGVRITVDGTDDCWTDILGHGTAVAGAIREKSPTLAIYAVKVFDRSLATSGSLLLRALDWCITQQMTFINLSLGTLNAEYVPAFAERVGRAIRSGLTIVSAFDMNGAPAYPGSLSGVVGVKLDYDCPRDRYVRSSAADGDVYLASGFPRSIPGVPPHRNLHGISFAVANVTGLLAAQVEAGAWTEK
jgi:subtilisin family serine protease